MLAQLEHRNLRPFQVPDDTMNSKFQRGDYAMVDVTDLSLGEGLHVFEYHGFATIYRVTRGPGVAVLSKDCPHYISQTVSIEKAREHVLGRITSALIRV